MQHALRILDCPCSKQVAAGSTDQSTATTKSKTPFFLLLFISNETSKSILTINHLTWECSDVNHKRRDRSVKSPPEKGTDYDLGDQPSREEWLIMRPEERGYASSHKATTQYDEKNVVADRVRVMHCTGCGMSGRGLRLSTPQRASGSKEESEPDKHKTSPTRV